MAYLESSCLLSKIFKVRATVLACGGAHVRDGMWCWQPTTYVVPSSALHVQAGARVQATLCVSRSPRPCAAALVHTSRNLPCDCARTRVSDAPSVTLPMRDGLRVTVSRVPNAAIAST